MRQNLDLLFTVVKKNYSKKLQIFIKNEFFKLIKKFLKKLKIQDDIPYPFSYDNQIEIRKSFQIEEFVNDKESYIGKCQDILKELNEII
ncbi:23903_t:CDS:2 [Gigaspora margarita]|uniref:23903_t:CDS:1 n=1 Tax=Gigaspora margarita TaxID=4874 RepID=A0ABN7XAB0_GIGMA|nr:23903_t:CDS:2 [Gigaspora margarita]